MRLECNSENTFQYGTRSIVIVGFSRNGVLPFLHGSAFSRLSNHWAFADQRADHSRRP